MARPPARLVSKRVRLDPDTRRAQLVELGVRMLATRRLDELSVEALAEQAGVSRGLLFHYFRSKQEFHLEVVHAAARELLERTAPDASLAPLEQLKASLAAFVDYVAENRDAYLSLVRGAASGDVMVRRVSDETRAELANRVLEHLDALGLPADTRTDIAVRGWVAFCEEAVICWLNGADGPVLPREDLLALLADALPGVVLRADPRRLADLS
jgi:AcrR family transcriptional regulator